MPHPDQCEALEERPNKVVYIQRGGRVSETSSDHTCSFAPPNNLLLDTRQVTEYCRGRFQDCFIWQARTDKTMEQEPRDFEIWIENFQDMGDMYDPARCLGTGTGRTFREACVNFFTNRNDQGINDDFDPEGMTARYGRRLFDSEKKAKNPYSLESKKSR